MTPYEQGYWAALMKLGALSPQQQMVVRNKARAFAESNAALAATRAKRVGATVETALKDPTVHATARKTGLPARDLATLLSHGRIAAPPPTPVAARFAS